MATTTNFGWETPDDTDLVKDGAAAIRTLGSAIDTSLVDLKGGTTGQVLSKTSNTDMDFTWVTSDDANAIQNAIVDAKGDLIAATANDTPARLASSGVNGDVLTVDTTTATGLKWSAPAASSPLTTKGDLYTYTTTNARLGVGNNGETLVADSSTSTGLRWQGNFAAGKNIVINGDFRINQRSFTSTTSNGIYGHDRWSLQTNSTCTYSTQTFTPGTAPVTGYEGINFARMASTTNSSTSEYIILQYKAEDVRTLAAQTATVSFWAKAASGTPKVGVEISQVFGSGGSGAVNGTGQTVTLSTSWTRYSVTIAVPSISGKTIGTNNYLELNFWCSAGSSFNGRSGTVGNQSATIDIWGVQLEAGNVATAFQTATGTLAGELAACQRYYWRQTATGASNVISVSNSAYANNGVVAVWPNPVPMRVKPSSVDSSSVEVTDWATATASNSITVDANSTTNFSVAIVGVAGTPLTQYRPYTLRASTSTGYIGFSAEL